MNRLAKTALQVGWKAVPFKSTVRPIARRVASSRLMPGCWMRSLRAYRIFSLQYGHLRSAATMRSIDRAGEPLPWITYPAVEFLKQLDLSDKSVFEYGCGGSTIFWGRAARTVDSVEHIEAFYREIRPMLPSNCHLSLEIYPESYLNAIARRGEPYDVIVIDGHSRVACSRIAPAYLRPGGFIVLDNSEWFYEAAATLRESDLIEVDMSGFAPINDFVSTTSFFFHRDYRVKPKADRQPVGAIGSIPKPNFPKVTGPVEKSAP